MKTRASLSATMAMKEPLELRGGGPELSVGPDLHKRHSQLEVLDDAGVRQAPARLPNELEQVVGFFRSFGEPCRVVLEAGWNGDRCTTGLRGSRAPWKNNWVDPDGVRAIVSAQVKTDRIDARMLGRR